MVSCAIRLCTLTWLTPLELAACAHVVNAAMHWDLFTCSRESIHHKINAATEPSAQEIATITLALLILSLSVADWHVPRWLQHHQLLCQLLTAMCMHTLRSDCWCTIMAFLLPTFGKIWAHPLSHILVAMLVVPLAAFSIRRGYLSHQKRWVLITAYVGIIIVLTLSLIHI